MNSEIDRLIELVSKNHEERREWHRQALERDGLNEQVQRHKLTWVVLAALLRPLIELAILIVLVVKL